MRAAHLAESHSPLLLDPVPRQIDRVALERPGAGEAQGLLTSNQIQRIGSDHEVDRDTEIFRDSTAHEFGCFELLAIAFHTGGRCRGVLLGGEE